MVAATLLIPQYVGVGTNLSQDTRGIGIGETGQMDA